MEQDAAYERLNREIGTRENIDFMGVPRSTPVSLDTPSITTRRNRPPFITELGSVPERRPLFDDDEIYETRAERSQIIDDLFQEEPRKVGSKNPE